MIKVFDAINIDKLTFIARWIGHRFGWYIIRHESRVYNILLGTRYTSIIILNFITYILCLRDNTF